MKAKRHNRKERLESEIQKAVYEIINEDLKNPNICGLVSVSRVQAAQDLSFAKVYISIYDGDEERRKQSFKEIELCANKIRYLLARKIDVRIVPALQLTLDNSIEYSEKINKLLKDLNKD